MANIITLPLKLQTISSELEFENHNGIAITNLNSETTR